MTAHHSITMQAARRKLWEIPKGARSTACAQFNIAIPHGAQTPLIAALFVETDGPKTSRPRRRADGASLEHKFWLRVEKTDSCWLWLGPLKESGYGKFSIGKRGVRAHRWIWEHRHGAIPPGLELRHICDTRRCVRPDHMELGTHAENMTDMTSRQRQARGETISRAKLTFTNIRAARVEWAAGATVETLAKKYNIGASGMSRALRGETWKHVE